MSASTLTTSNVSNAEVVTLAQGAIVRISAANAALRAQADAPGNLAGTIGVAQVGARAGVSFPAVLAGESPVLMEAGLTLLPGQAIYVSGTQAGRGTNVAPASPVRIGTIKNILNYATTALVAAIVAPPAATAAAPGGGATILFGTAQFAFSDEGGGTSNFLMLASAWADPVPNQTVPPQVGIPVTRAGIVRNLALSIFVLGDPGSVNTFTATVWVGGVATPLEINVVDLVASATFTNVADEVAASANDQIQIVLNASNPGVAELIVAVSASVEFVAA